MSRNYQWMCGIKLWKKGLSTRPVEKEIVDVEGTGIINECVAQDLIRYFREGDISFENKGQGDLLFWRIRPCLKWFYALIHCW